MTLISKYVLDKVKVYHNTKNEVMYVNSFKSYSLNKHRQRQTAGHDENISCGGNNARYVHILHDARDQNI